MKNRKFIIGSAVAVIAAIFLFFAAFSGQRGVGTYTTQTYAGCYDRPDPAAGSLITTAQPGEELRVTHVSKSGWATVDHPDFGKLYTNFFSLTPEDVRYKIRAGNFYDGNETRLLAFQGLLWLIFLTAAGLILCMGRSKEKSERIITAILIAEEAVYALLYILYLAPADVLIGTAFDRPLYVVPAFILNMAGLIVLAFAHIRLLRIAYKAVITPNLPATKKIWNWALMIFVILFSLYIAIRLIIMALTVVICIAVGAGAIAVISFISDFERSHVTLTHNSATGKWSKGSDDYEVDTVRGTARKKKLFEL